MNTDSNNNSKRLGVAIIVTFITGCAIYAFNSFRKNRQEKIQKQVDDSIPETTLIDEEIAKEMTIEVEELDLDLSTFEKCTINDDEAQKWKNMLFTIGGEVAKAGINISSFNGLLKCDVPLSDLCKVKNNPASMRGYVMKDGKILKQATFSEVGFTDVAPLMVYQCLSAITSQYYQHIITEQLSTINRKLDSLYEILTTENRGKLKSAHKRLFELCHKTTYDISDKQDTLYIRTEVDAIKEKYKELVFGIKIDNFRIGHKNTNKEEAETKIKAFKESNYFKYLEIAIQAEYLYYIASIILIKIAKYLENDEDVQIFTNSIELDFWNNYFIHFKRIKHDIIYYLECQVSKAWIQEETIQLMKEEMEQEFDSMENLMKNIQSQFEYKPIMYIKLEEDGSVSKYLDIDENAR